MSRLSQSTILWLSLPKNQLPHGPGKGAKLTRELRDLRAVISQLPRELKLSCI